MQPRIITKEYEAAAAWLRERVLPWRRLTIAIDGVDHAGKSSLARFLSWQLGMPAIEADFALDPRADLPVHRIELLKQLIDERHRGNRPVVVEGVFVLRALAQIGVAADYVVVVQAEGRRGSLTWQRAFTKYRAEYPRSKLPDYVLRWVPKE